MSQFFTYSVAILLGLAVGMLHIEWLIALAQIISDLFMHLLQLVSLPILFLSILHVASSVEEKREFTIIGMKVVKYTLITTVLAATVALCFFVIVDPAKRVSFVTQVGSAVHVESKSYLNHLINAIPSNVIQPFATNNVLGVLFLAFIFSAAILAIAQEKRRQLHLLISSLYAAFMKVTEYIIQALPIVLWAFICLFVQDVQRGLELKSIGLYLCCVVGANLFQAFVVLPLFLKAKKIQPLPLAKAMSGALILAFFTKSSSATVPTAVRLAENNARINPKVASLAFPLCTSINMNGCAAFILTTVLFVSQTEGFVFNFMDYFLWVFIATIAAIGNAGVPMGCYFLSAAFLAAMNVPLHIMGVILPFYSLIDAVETAINVWSDSCVAKAVDKDLEAPVQVIVEIAT